MPYAGESSSVRPRIPIQKLSEWNEAVETTDCTLLLQCGSASCNRCPEFTEAIENLKSEWVFNHIFVDTHSADEDLLSHLEVTKLPAYVLVAGGEGAKGQGASPQEVEVAVRTFCRPRLQLDADF